MDEWDVPPPAQEQKHNAWDDEDADDGDVKESWEDEEEEVQAPRAQTAVLSPERPKKISEPRAAAEKPKGASELGGVAEKLRQQRLVEESDYRSTTELFSKKSDEKSIDTFIPKSESDFLEYAELLSYKLCPFDKSFHYVGLLKAVLRLSMVTLKASDAKEIATCVSAIANEKLKAEREMNAGRRRAAPRKKQLHVGRPDDDLVPDAYDNVEDFDFM